MNTNARLVLLTVLSSVVAASCGGGSGANSAAAPPAPAPGPVDNATRAAAAMTTAQSNALCKAIQPFYWEIGDSTSTPTQALASGSVGTQSNGAAYRNTDVMQIASASKLPFAAYVIEKYGLGSGNANVPYLNFTSGYSNFDNALCGASQTVGTCNNGSINTAEAASRTFHYEGGHMQQLAAVNLSLGAYDSVALATELNSMLGSDVGMLYAVPQPPGGISTSAQRYAIFLRRLLAASATPLRLGALLGTQAVCTKPSGNCNAAPSPTNLLPDDFHYSLGHWVEDDPTTTPTAPVDNRAYSSAGAHGFYPWVDFSRTLYGIIARQDGTGQTSGTGEGYSSLQCGRLIRYAWKTGAAQ